MKHLAILGATGSIGNSVLKIIDNNPTLFSAHILVGGKNCQRMFDLIRQYKPAIAIMSEPTAAKALRLLLAESKLKCVVEEGHKAICAATEASEIDIVVAAIVGAAGLESTLSAIKAGKRVLLANKEALVMSGQLFMEAVAKSDAELLPIDSEHNAIYQAMPKQVQHNLGFCDLQRAGVSHILLTGSGGPFRTLPFAAFANVTPAQACKHPNWTMGRKISVDSATMMNKGLEYIEAKYLFNAKKGDIQVLVHPQSIVHSMVQYIDGSVIAQMGNPDMATPIAYAMSYPDRVPSGVAPLDFLTMGSLDFESPDYERYPCLKLAIDACYHSQSATTALNAANEVAVAAFLNKQISYPDIANTVAKVLDSLDLVQESSLEVILTLDAQARKLANKLIGKAA